MVKMRVIQVWIYKVADIESGKEYWEIREGPESDFLITEDVSKIAKELRKIWHRLNPKEFDASGIHSVPPWDFELRTAAFCICHSLNEAEIKELLDAYDKLRGQEITAD